MISYLILQALRIHLKTVMFITIPRKACQSLASGTINILRNHIVGLFGPLPSLMHWKKQKCNFITPLTNYLSLQPKPDFFNLRTTNFISENFHLIRRFSKWSCFPLIDHKVFKWLLFWVYKVVTTEAHQSKTLLFSKRKLAVTNK